ncbi:MAG TPA: alpha/beta hydrolase [Pedobacter sp.]|jgi:acetyl esterase/lipase
MKGKIVSFFLFIFISDVAFAQSVSRLSELPSISYKLPGEQLMASSEKILYKTTTQRSLYFYLLRPEAKRKKALPAIIYFSGGGWVQQSVAAQIPTAAWFRDHGIIAICAEYRVKNTDGTTPLECIKDAKSAARYVRANAKRLGVDASKIIVAGGSAGAHIALCTQMNGGDEEGEDLTISTKPNALVLHNPVLGEGYGKDFFILRPEFSPILQAEKAWPPVVLSCGTADKTTPYIYAQKFERLMTSAGNNCKLITVDGADHGCDWPVSNPNFLPVMIQITKFLQKEKFLPKTK